MRRIEFANENIYISIIRYFMSLATSILLILFSWCFYCWQRNR